MPESGTAEFDIVLLWKQNDWGFYNRRDEAILKELARRDAVGIAVHIEHLTPRILLSRVKSWLTSREQEWRLVFRSHVQKALLPWPIAVKENSTSQYFITSILVPYQGANRQLNSASRWLVRLQLRVLNNWLKKTKRPTVILAYPPSDNLNDAISNLDHQLLLADIEDDIAHRTKKQEIRRRTLENFRQLLPKCEWVFATSVDQDARYGQLAGQKIFCIPNAANISSHSRRDSKPHQGGRITAGYIGSINQTLDVGLLRRLLAEFPDVNFIFAGAISPIPGGDFRALLAEFENLHYTGPLHHSKIPDRLAQFDVLLNIKKADNTTAGGDSQKLYEYLATGKPILSSSIPPAPRFAEFIYVSDTQEASVECFRKAISENDMSLRQRRIRAAAANSWQIRVDVILTNILHRLPGHKNSSERISEKNMRDKVGVENGRQ